LQNPSQWKKQISSIGISKFLSTESPKQSEKGGLETIGGIGYFGSPLGGIRSVDYSE